MPTQFAPAKKQGVIKATGASVIGPNRNLWITQSCLLAKMVSAGRAKAEGGDLPHFDEALVQTKLTPGLTHHGPGLWPSLAKEENEQRAPE